MKKFVCSCGVASPTQNEHAHHESPSNTGIPHSFLQLLMSFPSHEGLQTQDSRNRSSCECSNQHPIQMFASSFSLPKAFTRCQQGNTHSNTPTLQHSSCNIVAPPDSAQTHQGSAKSEGPHVRTVS